jgi:methylthioribose-1-phosphate isomerase
MMAAKFETIRWVGDESGHVVLADQTRLPLELVEIECRDVETVWEAIKQLRVRGAPAIGIAAAYGVVLGQLSVVCGDEQAFFARLNEVAAYLASSRPTAVNLFWALERMQAQARSQRGLASPADIQRALLAEARAIHEEDRAICHAIGRFGAELLAANSGVLTHCNAGGLATSEYGTALSVFFTCQDQGKRLHVFVDETRPLLQGSRLTAWELAQRGIDATLICDNMAGQVMREGKVQAVIVGADRIAANGDTANKIGTLQLAVLARHFGARFMVVAPRSTVDMGTASGADIPIELRDPAEMLSFAGTRVAAEGVQAPNPVFDVAPAELIDAIVTELGAIPTPDRSRMAASFG